MAYSSGSGTGGSYNKKQKAVDDYWENYEKYHQTKPKTTKKTTQGTKITNPSSYKKTTQGTKITNPSSYSAPPKSSSTTTVTSTSSTPDRNYAKEIEDELKKDNIDWNKVIELGTERNKKISSGNMDVESTEALVERLYGNRNATPNKPGTGIIEATPANDIAGVPNKIETVQVEPTADPMAEYQEYLEQLQEAQRQSRIAALDKARSNALTDLDTYRTGRIAAMDTAKSSNLTSFQNALDASMQAYDTEGAAITPAYYEKRRQATGASDIGAMNFAQYMASRGIKGSAGAMPEIYRNAGLNQQIGALNQAEAADVSDLARRRSTTQNAYNANVANLENAYNTDLAALNADYEARKLGIQNSYDADVAGVNADIDAQGLQAYIDQMNADRAYGLQEAAMTGYLNGTPTLEGMQYQQSQQDAQRQQWLDTIGQFSNNYQAEIDRVSSDNDTSNDWQIPYLKAKRQQKITDQAAQAAAAAAAQGEAEQQAWENAFKLFQQVGRITSPQQAQILGIDQNATVADIDIARMNAQTSRMNAETSRQNAQAAANKPKAADDSYSRYMSKAIGLVNGGSSTEQVVAYIKSLPISAEQKAQMANDLGL